MEMNVKRVVPNGEKIAGLRSEKGIKQAVFADLVGVSERTLRDIERTNKSIMENVAVNIATNLSVTPDEIIDESP